MTNDMLPVTKPFLPPLEEFLPYLESIWKSRILTNNGPLHQELEKSLQDHLEVPHISLFSNGTLALIVALKAMNIVGKVITTPYTFIATSHAIIWNNLEPIFVDIDPETFNIDVEKIESAITPDTTAILAVHVYGNPCNTEKINQIAKKYNLKVIYDAAHCFGVRDLSRNILTCGNLSILSFHATKIFNTFEGGAIICKDIETKKKIDYLKNFGFENETVVASEGINAKMSEINCALGLAQIPWVAKIIEKRKKISERYTESLAGIEGIKLYEFPKNISPNYSYYPIIIDSGFSVNRDELYDLFKNHGVYTRRYFYPLVTEQKMYCEYMSANKLNLQNATTIASKVLCMPIYPDLKFEDQDKIINVIKEAASKNKFNK